MNKPKYNIGDLHLTLRGGRENGLFVTKIVKKTISGVMLINGRYRYYIGEPFEDRRLCVNSIGNEECTDQDCMDPYCKSYMWNTCTSVWEEFIQQDMDKMETKRLQFWFRVKTVRDGARKHLRDRLKSKGLALWPMYHS